MPGRKKKAKDLHNIYSNEEVAKLRDRFHTIHSEIPYNPFYSGAGTCLDSLCTWYEALSLAIHNQEVADLIDGDIEYDLLPLYVTAVNEYYREIALWRFYDIKK